MSKPNTKAISDADQRLTQAGFSLVEMMVAITVMLIVVGAVFSLMSNTMKLALTTYEMTDAQQNMRTSQEFINRDLMNAGDGLESISNIIVPAAFATGYISLNALPTLGIFTTDNNVPANTAVTGAATATTLKTGSDRQTILELDPEFLFNGLHSISLAPAAITTSGGAITIPAGDAMTSFTQGEVYFLSSSVGATFCTITNVNSGTRVLSFATGDTYGLNLAAAGGNIRTISAISTLATSLQRMRIIQYYVTSTGLLMRRVFGIPGAGLRDSIVAEHVLDVQFNYSLITTDAAGNVTASTSTVLTTSLQQLAVRQVEVKITVETPHVIQNGARQSMTTTTSTSVRNMQFRQAL